MTSESAPRGPFRVGVSKIAALFTDRDAFLVLYALTVRTEPVGSPTLAKAYRIDPPEMKEILQRLVRLGLAEKRGHAFVPSEAGAGGIRFLQTLLKNVNLEAARPESGTESSLVSGSYRNGSAAVVTATTNNGIWGTASSTGIVLSSSMRITKVRSGNPETCVSAREVRQGEITPDAPDAPDHAYL